MSGPPPKMIHQPGPRQIPGRKVNPPIGGNKGPAIFNPNMQKSENVPETKPIFKPEVVDSIPQEGLSRPEDPENNFHYNSTNSAPHHKENLLSQPFSNNIVSEEQIGFDSAINDDKTGEEPGDNPLNEL